MYHHFAQIRTSRGLPDNSPVWPWEMDIDLQHPFLESFLTEHMPEWAAFKQQHMPSTPMMNDDLMSMTATSMSEHMVSIPHDSDSHHHHSRHLLDTFGDSLRFVNNIYNKAFGKEQRKGMSM